MKIKKEENLNNIRLLISYGLIKNAQDILEKILNKDPNNLEAIEIACTIAINKGEIKKAINILKKSLLKDSKNFKILNNLGSLLTEDNQLNAALQVFNQALTVRNDFTELYNNRGIVYHKLGLYKDALDSYDKSINLNSNYAIAYLNKSNTLLKMRLLEESLVNINNAIKLKIDKLEEAYNIKGMIYYELNKYDESLSQLEIAIKINKYFPEPYNNLGNVFKVIHRLNEAEENYLKAISLKNNFAEAYANIGIIKRLKKEWGEALNYLNLALNLNTNLVNIYGLIIHTKMQLCDWNDLNIILEEAINKLILNRINFDCFPLLAVVDDPNLHKKIACLNTELLYPKNEVLGKVINNKKQKIKIGYFTSDFKEHPISYLVVDLFEKHDKNKFEIFGFYYGEPNDSSIKKRIEDNIGEIINIQKMSDKEVAILSRNMEIDIAIDLTGMTEEGRKGIFSYRVAPVQISYLGYLGSMGADYYDYIIADEIIVSKDDQRYYNEKIIYLPSYQVNDSNKIISNRKFTRHEFEIPENSFVYICLNSSYKITKDIFNIWTEILKSVPDSILIMYADNKVTINNINLELLKQGLSLERVKYFNYIKREEYIARYKIADLFLDTLPYNAGTTASDALRAGLPILTCMGKTFASRVCSSILNSINLNELICTTVEEYKNKAIKLGNDRNEINKIKEKLEINLYKTALFDTKKFTKNIENAYKQAYNKYLLGNSLDHIYVK